MKGSVRPSVRLSVCLSVCPSVTPTWLCSHQRIIMKFSGVINIGRSDVHAKSQGQMSKVKVTEVKTQLSSFRPIIPVWIHIWWWYDTQSLMMLRRGTIVFRGHPSNVKITQADKSMILIQFYLQLLGRSPPSNASDLPCYECSSRLWWKR